MSVIAFPQRTPQANHPPTITLPVTVARCFFSHAPLCLDPVTVFIAADEEIRYGYALSCERHIGAIAHEMTSAPGDNVPVTVYRITS